jgi:amidase
VIAALAERQLRIERQVPPPIREVVGLYRRLRDGDGGFALRGLLAKSGTETPSAGFKRRLDRVMTLATEEFAQTLQEVDRFKSEMLEFMQGYDALITPADVSPALPFGAEPPAGELYATWSYSIPWNVTGWPAAVVRAGTSAEGMPIGVQVIGRPWREDVVIALCRAIEDAFGGYRPPPL